MKQSNATQRTVKPMQIEYSKEAIKYIDKLDKPTKQRLKKAFDKLLKEPPQGDIKALQGQRNVYRLRVGDLRILFTINADTNIILITQIVPRGEAYKRKGGF